MPFAALLLVLLILLPHSARAIDEGRVVIQPGALTLAAGTSHRLGQRELAVQEDGNLVLRTRDGAVIWSTDLPAPCPTCVATYDTNGVLALRDGRTSRAVFSTPRAGSDFMVIQEDYPFLRLYRSKMALDGFPVQRTIWEAGVGRVGPAVRFGLRPIVPDPALRPPSYDFMVQDVCIDDVGLVTGDDPARCKQRRNIRLGEEIPYIISDWAWNQSYLHMFNVPALFGNKYRVVNLREFGKNSSAPGFIRAFGDYDLKGSDGFDVFEMDGDYASSVGTQDPVTNNTRFFWWNHLCQKEDGWIFFRNDLGFGQRGHTIANLKGGSVCEVNPWYSRSLTMWENYQVPRHFTNGKQLNATFTAHFGTATLNSLINGEFFYFTREYGFSRWERWENDADKMEKYESGSCNGVKKTQFGNEPFFRHSCRDWTTILPRKIAEHPYRVPLEADFVTSRNLVRAADFANGVTDGWNFASVAAAVTADPVTGNFSARLDCSKGCPAPGLNQDFSLAETIATYQAAGFPQFFSLQNGVTLTANPGTVLSVVLHLWGPNDRYYGPHGVTVTMPKTDLGPRPVRFRLPWNVVAQPLARARLEISTAQASGQVVVDDVFVAVLPAALGTLVPPALQNGGDED